MKPEIKFRLLISFTFVCVAALLAQSYFLWNLNQNLNVSHAEESSIPDSISERLEPSLSEPDAYVSPLNFNNLIGQKFRSDPFERMQQMQQQMDSLFNSFSGAGASAFGRNDFNISSPRLSLSETEEEYQVFIQMPPDQEVEVSTSLEENLLTVNGITTLNSANSNNSYASNFTARSQFSRSFDLSKPVNELGLYTEQQEGGLLIGIPKR